MITKELEDNKMCLFCASDYHLEMILLPYIKERINNSKFIILTESNLEETLDILLGKLNINETDKKKIKDLNWSSKDKKYMEIIKKYLKNNENINIIVNGEYDFIKAINNELKDNVSDNINIINCFHVSDTNVNIETLSKEYKYILNTKKI